MIIRCPIVVAQLLHSLCIGFARIEYDTVYDRIFGDFHAKHTVYMHPVYIWFWPALLTQHIRLSNLTCD